MFVRGVIIVVTKGIPPCSLRILHKVLIWNFVLRCNKRQWTVLVITQDNESIKPYLVMSIRELLIVSNIVRTGSLLSDIVSEKEVIFDKFDFELQN